MRCPDLEKLTQALMDKTEGASNPDVAHLDECEQCRQLAQELREALPEQLDDLYLLRQKNQILAKAQKQEKKVWFNLPLILPLTAAAGLMAMIYLNQNLFEEMESQSFQAQTEVVFSEVDMFASDEVPLEDTATLEWESDLAKIEADWNADELNEDDILFL